MGPTNVVQLAAADPVGSVMTSVEEYLGVIGRDVAQVLLCTGTFATVLSTHNIIARYLFSMGRDRVLPAKLGFAHRRYGSPFVASSMTSVFAIIFIAALLVGNVDSNALYAKLGGISSFPMMILLALTCAAIPVYFKRHRHPGQNLWKTTVAPIIAGFGFIGVLVLATDNAPFLVGGSREVANGLIAFFFVLLLAGVIAALILRRVSPEVLRSNRPSGLPEPGRDRDR